MLLYGPPGTGKSTIARTLAETLGWPLLTVTPSDFIASGGEAVEARAKAIFQVLDHQTELVVLFDEIDNLLLDRDSKLYREQAGFVQASHARYADKAEPAGRAAATRARDSDELLRAYRSSD